MLSKTVLQLGKDLTNKQQMFPLQAVYESLFFPLTPLITIILRRKSEKLNADA